MGLFDKKFCDFCGEKLGLFGYTTLSDGRICKNCASRISYWWSIGKKTSVADIHEHFYYREDNKAKVAEFRVSRSLGDYFKVLVDDDARRVMITSASDFTKANPDVFEFADITSARYDIEESKSELRTTDKDGKSVSYEPKRYEYRYDFYITAYVKNPYFDTLRFKINRSYVTIDPYAEGEAREAKLKAEAPQQTIVTHRQTQYGFGVSAPQATVVSVAPDIHVDRYTPDTENNEDYQTYKKMAEEIVAVLSEQ